MVDRAALDRLRDEIPELEARLARSKNLLRQTENQCQHIWLPTKQTTESRQVMRLGQMITRGVDIDYERIFVLTDVPIWTRECKNCGKIEKTDTTKPVTTQVPRF